MSDNAVLTHAAVVNASPLLALSKAKLEGVSFPGCSRRSSFLVLSGRKSAHIRT